MSSIYTIMLLSAMRLWNIVFIIVWNVVGELVSPKNMTVGSYSLLFVVNAALIAVFDLDIVLPPFNIKFGE